MSKWFSIGSKYEYCPNGNYWQDISGILDERIYLFCDCNKCDGQIYELTPRKVRLDESRKKELIDKQRKFNRLNDIKDKINYVNMDKVDTLLTQSNIEEK